jgi:NAD(P)-dependent dehydrogenase (short-subunit alcohol dehydrogenase family)
MEVVDGIDLSGKACVITGASSGQPAAAGNASIVALSSGGHAMGDVDFDDPKWESREYDKFVAYDASKTANILHAVEADRRLRGSGIRAHAVHPGTVATSLWRYMSRADFSELREMVAARGEQTDGSLDLATRTGARCTWKTAGSATRSRPTRATNSARRTGGSSPKSCVTECKFTAAAGPSSRPTAAS